MKDSDDFRYMTKVEAATYLRVSARKLEKIMAKGDIIGARIGGRRLLFRRQDLDAYVESRLGEACQ